MKTDLGPDSDKKHSLPLGVQKGPRAFPKPKNFLTIMSEPYVRAFVYICVRVRESGLTNPTSPLSHSRVVDGKTYNRVHSSDTRNQSDFIQLGQHSVGHGCVREHGLKRVFCPHPRPSSDPSCLGTPASAGQCQLKRKCTT